MQYIGDVLAQARHVVAFTVDQNHKVVRVADDAPVRSAVSASVRSPAPGRHRRTGLPRRHQVLVERRQGDVGQQGDRMPP
jgi:hypothetical protein